MPTKHLVIAILAVLAFPSLATVAREPTAPLRTRSFTFDYQAVIKDVPQGSRVRIWLPIPPDNDHQSIVAGRPELPATATIAVEPKYGNRMLYCETVTAGDADIKAAVSYDVKRREGRGTAKETGIHLSQRERELYLAANSLVPINDPRPALLIQDIPMAGEPLDLARRLYLRVDEHMKYDKSRPGYGNGDVLWACDSRFGNCTDFHSLFIAFARSRGLAARFEIGFPLPVERGSGEIGGYHCWAFFFVDGKGWFPVDISEADKHPDLKDYYFGSLTENRVTFSVGRDLILRRPSRARR